MRLADSVIVVSGAGSGIGRAAALAAAGRGAHVVAIDRHQDRLDELTARTGGLGVFADVASDDHADHVVAAAVQRYGRIDAVVANAGVGYDGEFVTMPAARIAEIVTVNVRAPMLLARAALPHLLATGRPAALLFTTSIAGAVPVPGEAAYSASKMALEGFVDALRGELRGTRVAVSTVRPGVVATPFHDRRNEPYERSFPRLITAERVAEVILDVLESGASHRTVPRWLSIATHTYRSAPRLYSALVHRFG